MKKPCFWLSRIFVMALLVGGPYAYADEAGRFDEFIQSIHAHRVQMESQLGLDPQADTWYPHATSYYDDLEDHYEQDQIMRDVIDEGIR